MTITPDDYGLYQTPKWSSRFKFLQDLLTNGTPDELRANREDLYTYWFNQTSCEWVGTKPAKPGSLDAQIIEYQIILGRALLDYPDMDRNRILTRVKELEKAVGR